MCPWFASVCLCTYVFVYEGLRAGRVGLTMFVGPSGSEYVRVSGLLTPAQAGLLLSASQLCLGKVSGAMGSPWSRLDPEASAWPVSGVDSTPYLGDASLLPTWSPVAWWNVSSMADCLCQHQVQARAGAGVTGQSLARPRCRSVARDCG